MAEFIVMLLVLFLLLVEDEIFRRWHARRCGHDCSKCGYWPCPAHYCRRKHEGVKDEGPNPSGNA